MKNRIAWIAALAFAAFGSAAEAQTITAVYTTYSDTGVPTKLDITGTAFCTTTPCGTKAPVVRLAGNIMAISGSSPTGIGVPLTGQPDGDYLLSVTPSGKTAITYAFTLKSKTGGATGPQGPMGPQGPVGPAGLPGLSGQQGPAGPKGDTGAAGAPGSAGAPGAKGDKGDKGDAGDGFTFKGVWSASASYVARDVVTEGGSSYIAVLPSIGVSPATSVQYGGGNWALLAVRGANGEPGPAGTAGPSGPEGPQGPKGEAGAAGADGAPGTQGPAGAIGPQGLTGLQGPKGDKGEKGDKGDKGDTGLQGPPGLSSGASNFKGNWQPLVSYSPGDVVSALIDSGIDIRACAYLAFHASNTSLSPAYLSDPSNPSTPWLPLVAGCNLGTQPGTISANVTGLPNGQVLKLTANNISGVDASGSGRFTFPNTFAKNFRYYVMVDSQPAAATCSVIDGAGVIADSPVVVSVNCLASLTSTVQVVVDGAANPWDMVVNPGFNFYITPVGQWGSGRQPAKVNAVSLGISELAGTTLEIRYLAGGVSYGSEGYMDGNGYPTWNAGNSASIYTAAGTGNSNALIGVFTDASGVILGIPFIVGNGPLRKTAPLGAENLQLGINGPTGWLASNGGSLTVGVTVVATTP